MAMGNCFSPVMEGSQFQWNNIVVNSPVYITPIRRKKFKISFGEFDLSKVLSNVSSNCDIIIRDLSLTGNYHKSMAQGFVIPVASIA